MYTETIRLRTECIECGNTNYAEDDSGFYVCQTCGTISQIRCGAELDFDNCPRGNYRLKGKNPRKSSDDDVDIDVDNEQDINSNDDNSDIDTNFHTNVLSRNTSEMNDLSTVWGRKRSNKIVPIEKTLPEILIDSQRIFQKLFTLICSNEGYTNIKTSGEGEIDSCLIKYAKNIWFNYINKEYDIQTRNKSTPFGKARKSVKLVRSRANTIDEMSYIATNIKTTTPDTTSKGSNDSNNTKAKIKKVHLNEQLKTRKIKSENISRLYHQNHSHYTKGSSKLIENKKKFIEEYDEVIRFLKSNEIKNTLKQNRIELVNNCVTYSDLIRVCHLLNISFDKDTEQSVSFEELIHLIFIDQAMNYQTIHSCSYDSKKTTLNGDYYLALVYQIYNSVSNINESMSLPLLSRDIIGYYKQFAYITNLNQTELRLFNYSNYEKYTRLVNAYDHNDSSLLKRSIKIIEAINHTILHMPLYYISLCSNILHKIQGNILKILGNIYIIEDLCIAVCFYALKIIYGLNDLPYLSLLQKNKNDFMGDKRIIEAIELFKKNTSQDAIGNFYHSLPSLLSIIEEFSIKISQEEKEQIMTYHNSLKQNITMNYKEKYAMCNEQNLYSEIQNLFSSKNIRELENKFNKIIDNQSRIKINESPREVITIKKSNKFLQKSTKSIKPKLNVFLIEEIDFHHENTTNNDNCDEINIDYPYPCDTYIHANRQANKFDDYKIPTAEVIFLYFFAKYFKIDYNSLKILIKAVERSIDNSFRKGTI